MMNLKDCMDEIILICNVDAGDKEKLLLDVRSFMDFDVVKHEYITGGYTFSVAYFLLTNNENGYVFLELCRLGVIINGVGGQEKISGNYEESIMEQKDLIKSLNDKSIPELIDLLSKQRKSKE